MGTLRRLFLFLGLATTAPGAYFAWNAPSSANSGTTHWVSATATFLNATDVILYKNGYYFASGRYGAGAYSTDTGAQTVTYEAIGFDTWQEVYCDWWNVTITVPNNPPSASVSHDPSVQVLGTVVVTGTATDPDGDLESIGIRWQGYGLQLVHEGIAPNTSSYSASVGMTPPTTAAMQVRAECFDKNGNGYTGAWSAITVTPIPASFSFSNLSHTYDGSAKTAAVTPNPSGAGFTSDLTRGPGAGSYTVTAAATGNYTGSGSATLTIGRAPVSFAFSGGPSFTYTGSAQTVSVGASPAGATYTASGTWSATDPGSYTATATATGNYTGSGSHAWTIADVGPPSVPVGLAASNITTTSFTLGWTASTDNVGVTGYEVFRGGVSVGTTAATSMNITGLSAGTAYSMTVRARDAAANWSAQSTALNVTTTAAPDTTPPSVPVGLAASNITTTSFTLSWTASTDNVGVTGYEVFRGGVSIGTTAATSMNITGLSSGVSYGMTVRARDAAGNWSNPSTQLWVTTGMDPNGDLDGDGMPNGWEQQYGLNPTSAADALLDLDNDGLTNVAEYNLGKNPSVRDYGTSTLGNTIPAGWPNANADTTTAVGATAGQLSVDKSGALTYSIPIWTTPGSAGMQPEVSLNYSSNAGAGIAGFGWSISGTSAITRGPQTKMIDGANRGVTVTANDRFYLDGQRLIAINGANGADGTEYRTEIDSISKVISYGSAGSGPAWFKVWTKSGLIIELGNTPDSAFDAGGYPEKLSWHVNRISDTKGSYMAFVYYEYDGVLRLERINYTGNGGAQPYASLRFEYENRPDWVRGYVAGAPVSSLHRLKAIKSYHNETAARTYSLAYRSNAGTQLFNDRSMLISITESGSDGKSYRPLTFAYSENDYGWEETPGFSPAALYLLADNTNSNRPTGSGFMDLNGDGRTDFVARRDTAGINVAYLNNGTGWTFASNYLLPFRTADSAQSDDQGSRFVDLNGDGLVDYVWNKMGAGAGSGAVRNTGSGWTSAPQWTPPAPIAKDGEVLRTGRFLDVNGDGRPDFVSFLTPAGGTSVNLAVYLNNGSGWDALHSGYSAMSEDLPTAKARFVDLNGDGLVDIAAYYRAGGTTIRRTYLNTGAGWADSSAYILPQPIADNTQATLGAEFSDVNADGLPDLIWYREYSGSKQQGVALNTGRGWEVFRQSNVAIYPGEPLDPLEPWEIEMFNRYAPPSPLSRDNNQSSGAAIIDLNADGLADSIYHRQFIAGGQVDKAAHYGTGRNWTWAGAGAAHEGLPVLLLQGGIVQTGVDFVDFDSDGVSDVIWRRKHANGSEYLGAWRNKSKATADRLVSVANGFGVKAEISYDSLLNPAVYTKGTGGPSGSVNITGPMHVVSLVKNENGLGGDHNITYSYRGLRAHPDRGSLGFEWMEVNDTLSGIITNTAFKQEYPFIGMPAHSETRTSGGTVLSTSTVTYADRNATGLVRLPYASSAVESAYDLNGGALIRTTTTTTAAPDGYGNISSITVGTSDGFTKTTTNTYLPADTGNWILGRLSTAAVVSSAPSVGNITRNSSFTYEAGTGLLLTETVEPGNSTLGLTTTYGYDSWGNKTSVTVSGSALTVDSGGNYGVGGTVSRTTTTQYDGFGRFPIWTRNALNHQENYNAYDQVLGVLTQMTGANGLSTAWAYDGMGRRIQENRADGTVSQTRYKWAAGGAPAGSLYLIENESTGVAPSLSFHDRYGRAFRTMAISGEGKIVHQQTSVDALGRVTQTTNPYYADGSPIYASFTTYDALGRPLTVTTPDDENGPQTTTYAYSGLTATGTDPKGRVTETVTNSQGWTVSNVRNKAAGPGAADYSAVTYGYDALGNLTSTVAAGITTTVAYDLRGRKTSMVDPDMGTWHYRYNVFGELIWQKDAKNQIVTMVYDSLGRLASRGEPEGTTTWNYDTSPTRGIGKLHWIGSPGGYGETYGYDTLGRPSSVTRTIDGVNYTYQTAYDSAGRPVRTIYPDSGIGSAPFSTRQVYNAFGYLKEIRVWLDSDSGRPTTALQGRVYWMADSYDVSGRIDGETLGNGLANDRVYSDATGRLLRASIDRGSVLVSPFKVQDLNYSYDAVGNINRRFDAATNREELFHNGTPGDGYDGLDRLKVHKINGTISASVAYNQLGNITAKSDVGSYTYGSSKPHAVTSAGAQSYQYDANGNMYFGGGRTIEWTSFNQLRTVTDNASSKSSEFFFGASRERVKQVRKTGSTLTDTTIYAGSLYEKITPASGPVEHKHYVVAPTGRVAVFTDRSDFSNDLRYFHTDGLGSITVVTDEKGAVLKRFAYDAWGKQSTLANTTPFTATPVNSQAVLGGFTRGFTDHEMLADQGLIHMNGRVYDPVLGRFLSADPFIDGAEDAQGFNRYSYVGNNPLGATDPTGYFKLKDAFKIVAIVVAGIVTAGAALYAIGPMLGAAGASYASLGAAISAVTGGGLGLAQAMLAGAGFGFGSGFAGSLLNGGNIGDAFKAGILGAVIGGVTAGITHGIGTYAKNNNWGWGRTSLAHGLAHGGISEATGGEFRHGFYSGFFSSAAAGPISNTIGGGTPGQTIAAAIVGGTASAIGGGKFANGAVSGAFTYLFNEAAHHRGFQTEIEETPLSDWHVRLDALNDSAIAGLELSLAAAEGLAKSANLLMFGRIVDRSSKLFTLFQAATFLNDVYVQPMHVKVMTYQVLSVRRPDSSFWGASRQTVRLLVNVSESNVLRVRLHPKILSIGYGAIAVKPIEKGVYDVLYRRPSA